MIISLYSYKQQTKNLYFLILPLMSYCNVPIITPNNKPKQLFAKPTFHTETCFDKLKFLHLRTKMSLAAWNVSDIDGERDV